MATRKRQKMAEVLAPEERVLGESDFVLSDVHMDRSGEASNLDEVWSTFSMKSQQVAEPVLEEDEDGDLVPTRARPLSLYISHRMATPLDLVGLQLWRGAFILCDFICAYQVSGQRQSGSV
jgi:hypothetical protein